MRINVLILLALSLALVQAVPKKSKGTQTSTTSNDSSSTGPLGPLGSAPSDFNAGSGIPADYPPPSSTDGKHSPSGRYIVKLKDGATSATLDDINTFLDSFNAQNGLPPAKKIKKSKKNNRDEDSAVTDDDNDDHPNRIKRKFLNAFKGFSGNFLDNFLRGLRQQYSDNIDFIEPDEKVEATMLQLLPPSWGLARISNLALGLLSPYYYPANPGAGVDIFILDTAIQTSHSDFNGRASMMASYVVNDTNPTMDGHGTHVSGTAAGNLFGVAKAANIKGVQVLNNNRQGYYSWVVSGINYVVTQARPGKTVLNLSVSGSYSQSINDAITAAYNAGVVVIGAAGNSNTDACSTSPASAAGALTVSASNTTDSIASFSNYGSCVDLFAPGVNVRSDWAMPGLSNTATAYMSGTSQSVPHVSGIAALYMSSYSYPNPQTVYNDLTYAGNWNILTGPLSGSPNILAFNWQDPTIKL